MAPSKVFLSQLFFLHFIQGKVEFDLLFVHDDTMEEISQICIDNEGNRYALTFFGN